MLWNLQSPPWNWLGNYRWLEVKPHYFYVVCMIMNWRSVNPVRSPGFSNGKHGTRAVEFLSAFCQTEMICLFKYDFWTQTHSTQRERDRLLGGQMHAFRPFQFKHDISKLSAESRQTSLIFFLV